MQSQQCTTINFPNEKVFGSRASLDLKLEDCLHKIERLEEDLSIKAILARVWVIDRCKPIERVHARGWPDLHVLGSNRDG